jgi:hypothetical protein
VKTAILWGVTPCSLVAVAASITGYIIYLEQRGSSIHRNVGTLASELNQRQVILLVSSRYQTGFGGLDDLKDKQKILVVLTNSI